MTTAPSTPTRTPGPTTASIDPARTALVNIDWQTDFCGPGGYVDAMGYDLEPDPRRPRADRQGARRGPRRSAGPVVHTREGHRPDLSDCPPNKLWRSQRIGAGHRRRRARAGASSCAASPAGTSCPRWPRSTGELIIDKPGKGSFYATDLDLLLRTAGITHLVFTGITTDVCVHTTMRDANDRGYECLLLTRLHRRHRLRQLRGRAEDGDDAGRRVRRGRHRRRALLAALGA